jgi:endo-1,3-1,4-beta-glycanase ExoK
MTFPGGVAHAQDNLIVNGDFAGGEVEPWETVGDDLTAEVVDGRLCADVPGGTNETFHLLVRQRDIPLEAGENYTWTFTASASRPVTAHVVVRSAPAPALADLSTRPQLSTDPQTYTFAVTARNTTNEGEVRFAVGGHAEPWTFCVDDVSLVGGADEPPPVGDDLIVNGDFATGEVEPWEAVGDGLTAEVVDGRLCADVPGGTNESFELLVRQRDIPLTAGEHYTWTFTASASRPLTTHVVVRSAGAPAPADLSTRPTLETVPQTYEFVVTAQNTTSTGEVRFAVGGHAEPWTFCVDDISLVGGADAPPPDVGGESFVDDFDNGIDQVFWFVNDGYNNGGHQNCQFNADNATVDDGTLILTLDDTPFGDRDYSCGAIQTHTRYWHGTYETRMKAGLASGTNSSLFSYVGPHHGQPHDEIDFEVLGKDPTVVELNTWVAGSNRGPWPVDIGYDSSEQWVDFAWVWESHQIRYFINGELVHTVTDAADIPTGMQFIFTMLWGSDTLTGWMGPFEYPGEPITTEYEYVAFTRAGDECQFEGSVACEVDVQPPTTSFVENFDTINESKWRISDGWNNGPQQNCTWSRDQVEAVDGVLNLSFTPQPTGDRDYACAEIQHRERLGYGLYEARMKGIDGRGVLASMFTWIGGADGQPSEAIDMAKLLGRYPGEVNVDVLRADESLAPMSIDLPVDGSSEFVDYAVDWSEDRLDFYVDGELAASITDPDVIPDRETNLYFNIWGSDTMRKELGKVKKRVETLTFSIERVAYTAPGDACQFPESVACEE